MPKQIPFLLLALIAAGMLLSGFAPALPESAWQHKVEASLLQSNAPVKEFLVLLQAQADLSAAAALPDKTQRGAFVSQRLQATAAATQPAVLYALQKASAETRSYWIANMIWVRGGENALQTAASLPQVRRVFANPAIMAVLPRPQTSLVPQENLGVEWNIAAVNAPAVWAQGYTGQGVVVGGQDTGYDWQHPAIREQYRGWDGSSAQHDYNWHDAIHSGGGPCGPNSPEPCDDNGHGTHTMGTMVGDDQAGNQIGMAPAAKWIGCRNMDQGVGTPATYSECFQWFVAPTDRNGENPDPSKAPHIINNSWACTTEEGCVDPTILQQVIQNVRAAGILIVASAGNYGPSCNTVYHPPALYDNSFSVGAVDQNGTIAGFSSRGPATFADKTLLKPDISAPGVFIRSSFPGGAYASISGTSMAGPHVAGLAALLISAQPQLAGQVPQIEELITSHATPRTSNQDCGEDQPGVSVPNNTYGWGIIHAKASYDGIGHAFRLQKAANRVTAAPGQLITYTLNIQHDHPQSPALAVVVSDPLPPGTEFVSASGPYSLSQNKVVWNFGNLAKHATLSVELTVRVTGSASEAIINQQYRLSSDSLATPLTGPPVIVSLRSNWLSFPLFLRQQTYPAAP